MSRRIVEPGRLERIWQHAIIPLLRERYYGTPHEELDRFALADVRAAVGAPIE